MELTTSQGILRAFCDAPADLHQAFLKLVLIDEHGATWQDELTDVSNLLERILMREAKATWIQRRCRRWFMRIPWKVSDAEEALELYPAWKYEALLSMLVAHHSGDYFWTLKNARESLIAYHAAHAKKEA